MKWLIPPYLFLCCVAGAIALRFTLPALNVLDPPWTWLGSLLALAGIALAGSSKRLFERRNVNVWTFRDPDGLVSDGIFARTRNPMYLGFGIGLLGVSILSGNALALLFPVAFVAACATWYIPYEEAAMKRVHGQAYEAYQAEVPRWW